MMDFVLAVIVVLGGAATFVYGLKLLGEGTEKLVGAKLKKFVAGCVEKPFGGFLAGAAVAGVTQSSAAVTMVAVGLAEAGAITFLQAAPVVMGANVGTTVTAQFIAIFGRGGDYKSAVGALAAAAGVIFGFFKNKTLKNVGDARGGFGLMLSGLSALSGRINALKSYDFLSGFAYVDNPFLLFLLGAAVAAVTQSSSAITGILITFSENSFAAFYRAIFIITGSTVGSCAAVILSSANKSEPAREAAVFNFVFNAFGAILFLPILVATKNFLPVIFPHSATDAGRAMADFHTVFNLLSSLAAFPLLKFLCGVTQKLVAGQKRALRRKFSKNKKTA